jgi:hypothetical protein
MSKGLETPALDRIAHTPTTSMYGLHHCARDMTNVNNSTRRARSNALISVGIEKQLQQNAAPSLRIPTVAKQLK